MVTLIDHGQALKTARADLARARHRRSASHNDATVRRRGTAAQYSPSPPVPSPRRVTPENFPPSAGAAPAAPHSPTGTGPGASAPSVRAQRGLAGAVPVQTSGALPNRLSPDEYFTTEDESSLQCVSHLASISLSRALLVHGSIKHSTRSAALLDIVKVYTGSIETLLTADASS